ncbi:tetratricopeptide repeat (TPR)-containing protein [Tasmannia lanceolata]|uniref:tetratricopeptide repeat (TPR)-containing protein n=1 Tax=Tasmannia lanceolata TaxID=3420 RepID=UPI00406420E0
MGRDDLKLKGAKQAYKQASINGNRQEEARWANVIGDILKSRGEYVEALRWLRIDFEVSTKYLPEKQLLPTCQSIGELYLRLNQFKEALSYQKKHLALAKDTDDLIEQQRASTQLGRTYHELFSKSENDHYALRNAKKYFKLAMELAQTLKENPPSHRTSFFVKEFIDAHNNLGMLEMDLDNLDEAQKVLLEGLKICDDEEVNEDDDARSRLHNNLGSLYIELRAWDKAREHIEKDILICKRIGHLQGEAKGYINLGELHYRVQKYDEAILCYQKAHHIAKSMEDEDALVDQIKQNIETVKEAMKVLGDLKAEEQKFKKLTRTAVIAKGKPSERRCLLDLHASLNRLIEKSTIIFAWTKHREFAKRKKKVASELCDKEKLSDSFLAIGESYQKLRNFSKARKWYMKSWNIYRLIGNLEGQALAKINIGEVLDSAGDWTGALQAFEEGYRIAIQGNLPSVQISALENMHYSYMIRFDNVGKARKLQHDIENLKSSPNKEFEVRNRAKECCSETETEGDVFSDDGSEAFNSPIASTRLNPTLSVEEFSNDIPLASLIQPRKTLSKNKKKQLDCCGGKAGISSKATKALSRDTDDQEPVGRKRIRVVLSDDEIDECVAMDISRTRLNKHLEEDVGTSDEIKRADEQSGHSSEFQDVSHNIAPKDVLSACTPIHREESTCSFKSKSPKFTAENCMEFKSSHCGGTANSSSFAASGSKMDGGHVIDNLLQSQNGASFHLHTSEDYGHNIKFKIGDDMIHVDTRSCMDGDNVSFECLKVEVACLYFVQLSEEKRSKGVLPIIRELKCGDKAFRSSELVMDFKDYGCGEGWIEVVIDGWVHNRLMKLYIDYCMKLSEAPNMKLLKKLYNLEVSEDEVIISDCELQDMSISPFLNALQEHKTISVLDISHNLLGNGTMETLQQIFASSNQRYGGLTLDLHCNRFGPAALFQICECPVLFSRLEVLNLSENRLTDACGSYLSTVLENCKALYSLNIEQCSITSRTIQKVADALDVGSVLAELCLGRNNPISGNAMINLLIKLATLKRFSELNLNGVKLGKPIVDSLCQLAKSTGLTALMLKGTNIGADGAVRLTEALSSGSQELVKLDISSCGLTSYSLMNVCTNIALMGSLLELNLGGNFIGQEGCNTLASLLMNPQCCLKVLVLSKCDIGLMGVLKIIQAVTENGSLEELNLAENANADKENTSHYHLTVQGSPKPSQICAPKEIETAQDGLCVGNSDCHSLEVADSEDNQITEEPPESICNDDCTSLSLKNRFVDHQLFQELSTAIGLAKQLQLLDLSSNGFSKEVVNAFYSAWASSSRFSGSVQKHVEEKIVHFSVEGNKCCGVKVCCKRN